MKFSETSTPFENKIYSSSPYSSTVSLPNTLPSTSWVCPICSYKNQQQDMKCELCGVKKPENSLSTSKDNKHSIPLNYESVDQQFPTSNPSNPTDGIEIACPSCTFLNHPSMIKCELCWTFSIEGLSIENEVEMSKVHSEKIGGDDRPDFVKLAFRRGGSNSFYDKLKIAISIKEWEVWFFWFHYINTRLGTHSLDEYLIHSNFLFRKQMNHK